MSDTNTRLSVGYYVAEAAIWLLSAILLLCRFIGLAPGQALPVLNVTLEHAQHFPKVVAVLLFAAVVYAFVEWKQSSRNARSSGWAMARAIAAVFSASVSLWVSWSLVVQNTSYAGVSPGWYLGFLAIGCLLGTFVSVLAFSTLMIRDPQESVKLGFPRIPVATYAQYVAWFPLVLLLMAGYYILLHFSPAVLHSVAGLLVGIPFVAVLLQGVASLCLACDENRDRIPYRKRIAQLKEIHDAHDYHYLLNALGKEAAQRLDIPVDGSPQAIQQAMQERYSAASSEAESSEAGPLLHRAVEAGLEVQVEEFLKQDLDVNECNGSP